MQESGQGCSAQHCICHFPAVLRRRAGEGGVGTLLAAVGATSSSLSLENDKSGSLPFNSLYMAAFQGILCASYFVPIAFKSSGSTENHKEEEHEQSTAGSLDH